MDDKSPWQMPRNVFIELGIAIALNRPTLLLRHASNQEAGLKLPNCLQCLEEQILEFSGNHSLKKVLQKNLPKWVNALPDQAWWHRHCIFGGRVCEYREAHPRAKQFGQNTLNCSIADGADSSRPDFRDIVEQVLERFSDVTYTYLDALYLATGYSFLLCSHCQKVRSSPFAIYRITSKTPPEGFVAIGISLALEAQFEYKIPKILIAEDRKNVPSLLSGYEVVVAKSDKNKKDSLRKFIPTVIKRVREATWKPKPLQFRDILVDINNENELEKIVNFETSDFDLSSVLNQLKNLLISFMFSESERRAYILRALGINSPILPLIRFDASTSIFVTELIRLLLQYGEIQPGKQALSALLEVVREDVGVDKKLIIDNIISKLESISVNQEKIRIYELSEELNLASKEILAICKQLNIADKSYGSLITETDANRIRSAVESFTASNQAEQTQPASRRQRGIVLTKAGIETLQAAKGQMGLTNEELAEMAMISHSTISKIFRGKKVDKQTVRMICNVLGLEWEKIMKLDGAEDSTTQISTETDANRTRSSVESFTASNQAEQTQPAPRRQRGIVLTKAGIETLQAAKGQMGLTNEELAEMAMISHSTISKIFRGKKVDKQTVRMICNVLGLEWEKIMKLDGVEDSTTQISTETDANRTRSSVESFTASNQAEQTQPAPRRQRGIVLTKAGIETLQAAKGQMGLTNEELAEIAMISHSTISKIFSSKRVDKQTVRMICNVLGLEWKEIMK